LVFLVLLSAPLVLRKTSKTHKVHFQLAAKDDNRPVVETDNKPVVEIDNKSVDESEASKTRKTNTQLFAFLSTFLTFVFFSRRAERRAKPEKPKLNFLRF
jgi:hypothetical protein